MLLNIFICLLSVYSRFCFAILEGYKLVISTLKMNIVFLFYSLFAVCTMLDAEFNFPISPADDLESGCYA